MFLFTRDNLPKKTKDGACIINFDKYADVGTHWIDLFCRKIKQSNGYQH